MGQLSMTFMALPTRDGRHAIVDSEGREYISRIPSSYIAEKTLRAITDAYVAGQQADSPHAFARDGMFHGEKKFLRQLFFEGAEYGQICLQIPGPASAIVPIQNSMGHAFRNGFHDKQKQTSEHSWTQKPRF